jgi:hypothetical protein
VAIWVTVFDVRQTKCLGKTGELHVAEGAGEAEGFSGLTGVGAGIAGGAVMNSVFSLSGELDVDPTERDEGVGLGFGSGGLVFDGIDDLGQYGGEWGDGPENDIGEDLFNDGQLMDG